MVKQTTPPSAESRTARQYGSIEAAAKRLDVSPRTVRRMISRGEITAYRVSKRLLRVDLTQIDTVARRIPTGEGAE